MCARARALSLSLVGFDHSGQLYALMVTRGHSNTHTHSHYLVTAAESRHAHASLPMTPLQTPFKALKDHVVSEKARLEALVDAGGIKGAQARLKLEYMKSDGDTHGGVDAEADVRADRGKIKAEKLVANRIKERAAEEKARVDEIKREEEAAAAEKRAAAREKMNKMANMFGATKETVA